MNSKVSIIVPVYNVEKYIGQLIESVQEQSYRNIELILVDDGSKDRSGTICDGYASSDERLHVIHKENAGVGAARNDGLRASSGDWVIFCDSDDWLEKNAIKSLVEKGELTESDIVFGDVNLVYGDEIKTAIFYRDEFIFEKCEDIDKLISAVLCKTYCYNPPEGGPAFGYGGPWNKLVRKSLLIDNNIEFDLRVKGIFDDIIYTVQTFSVADRITYIHEPIYNYRQLASSITHKYKNNLIEINDAIFLVWSEFLNKDDHRKKFEKPYYANVIRRLTTTLGQYFFNENNKNSLYFQLKELSELISREPYSTAIRNCDMDKLNNRFDRIVVKAARRNSSLQIYFIFQASILKNRMKKVSLKNRIKGIIGSNNIYRMKVARGTMRNLRNKAERVPDVIIEDENWEITNIFSLEHKHVFFGYYDLQQFNSEKDKLLATVIKKNANPKTDTAELYWIDVKRAEYHKIDDTLAWCWQQGARLRWYPVDERKVVYNDVDDGKYVSRLYDINEGKIIRTYCAALYDITPDGKTGLSLNYSRLQRLRPGYGYNRLPDFSEHELAPDEGIYKIDLESNTKECIISIKQLVELTPEATDQWNYINHISISPDGNKFIFFHLWTSGVSQRWKNKLYVARIDGSELKCIEQQYIVSHYCWKDNDTLLATTVGFKRADSHYIVYNLQNNNKCFLDSCEMLREDGHPSFEQGKNNFISDTYPLDKCMQHIFEYEIDSGKLNAICSIYSDPRMFGENKLEKFQVRG